jgi:hypothetical protein
VCPIHRLGVFHPQASKFNCSDSLLAQGTGVRLVFFFFFFSFFANGLTIVNCCCKVEKKKKETKEEKMILITSTLRAERTCDSQIPVHHEKEQIQA